MPTPSERGNEPLARFLHLRDSLCRQRSGRGGGEVCEQLTSALDAAIAATPLPEGAAVVAVGGYGRRELSLYSDVDLMLLHSVTDPTETAAELFRPLWDARLRVGHAVRTVKEAAAAARERFDTHTTLLTSRLVTGDAEVFDRLRSEIAAVTRARPLRRHLVAEERRRRETTPHLLMATDVKSGRGGLRTLHGFEWERRREELIGRFSIDQSPERGEAAESLLRIRNALHAVTGRQHDEFSPDLREPVAGWLGIDPFEAAALLVEAIHIVDRMAAQRWPEVVREHEKRLWRRLAGSPPALSGTSSPTIDVFVWALATGAKGRLAIERMWDSGHLDAVLPEWGTVKDLPQLAPFHEHPVADHLWRTVDEMQRLLQDGRHYGRVADEIDSPRALMLAAFLHDIGKGHGGDHATVGAGIARALCERMDVPQAESALIEGAVLHHLLLPLTATRRDLDDPAVIDEVAATVGSLRLLQVLYLLTVADSRATGTTMWSDWKATLVRSLFARCAARFIPGTRTDTGTTREAVLAAAEAGRAGAVEGHLDAMPDEYLRSATTEEVLAHVRLVAEMRGVSNIGIADTIPAQRATVVGRATPAFRQRTAEALAANGIDVLEARLFSRSDGMAVDSYRVRDDRIGEKVRPERWESFRADLEAGLSGQVDVSSKLAKRALDYEGPAGDAPLARVSTDPASGEMVVVVKCADRIGRLAEILGALSESGLEIRLAQIESRDEGVVDTFHVASGPFGPVAGEELAARIARSLTP